MTAAEKTCGDCGKTKPTSDFYKYERSKDGLQPRCCLCSKKRNREWASNNKDRMSYLVSRWAKGHRENCLAAAKKYRENNRESVNAQARSRRAIDVERSRRAEREWYRSHPAAQRRAHLKRRYRMTLEDYETMLRGQGGVCKICGRAPSGIRCVLHVDHDHSNGRIRGLLCGACNTILGRARDSKDVLESAIKYLEAGQ